jgi:hypothetical protein
MKMEPLTIALAVALTMGAASADITEFHPTLEESGNYVTCISCFIL